MLLLVSKMSSGGDAEYYGFVGKHTLVLYITFKVLHSSTIPLFYCSLQWYS